MINTVKIIPYSRMQKYLLGTDDELYALKTFYDNVWIISITDKDFSPLCKESESVITLQFEDIDPESRWWSNAIDEGGVPIYPDPANLFSLEMAKKVVDFIVKVHKSDDNDLLLVNCMAGVSRSGAIGSFARQICSVDYNEFKRMNPQIVPNSYVYKLLNNFYCDRDQVPFMVIVPERAVITNLLPSLSRITTELATAGKVSLEPFAVADVP